MKRTKKLLALLLSLLFLFDCAASAFAEEPEAPEEPPIVYENLPVIDVRTGIAVTRFLYSELLSQPEFSDYLQTLMKHFVQETAEKGPVALIAEPIVMIVLTAPSWSFFVIIPFFAFFPRFAYRTIGDVIDLSSFHLSAEEALG